MLEQAHSLIRNTHSEMQHYLNAHSDQWLASDKGDAFQEKLDVLTETLELLESVQ